MQYEPRQRNDTIIPYANNFIQYMDSTQGLISIIVSGHSTDTKYHGNHLSLSLGVGHNFLHTKCKLTNHGVAIWARRWALLVCDQSEQSVC